MGAIGGLLGTAGGAGGTGFATPQQAPIQTPVSTQQATDAYTSNQDALKQQQSLLNSLQAQNGLQNQSNVYNQLQGVANGTGPNPAQAMLNQATGANVANQAALMAGQRGASQNVGLIARQAGQQGANIQQQAAGQGATMQAQQSLNALQGMGNLANTQAANQIGATGAVTTAQQAEQRELLGSIAQANNARVGMQSNINNANASMANTTMQGTQNAIGSLMNAGGAMSSMGSMAAEGGAVESLPIESENVLAPGPKSSFGQFIVASAAPLADFSSTAGNPTAPVNATASSFTSGKSKETKRTTTPADTASTGNSGTFVGASGLSMNPGFASGGQVDALVSPGEQYLAPEDVKQVKAGKNPLATGERIPGIPKVKGNSYSNDVVPKTLQEGGIVIPNSVMQSKNPAKEASKFVAAVLAKKGHKLPKKSN